MSLQLTYQLDKISPLLLVLILIENSFAPSVVSCMSLSVYWSRPHCWFGSQCHVHYCHHTRCRALWVFRISVKHGSVVPHASISAHSLYWTTYRYVTRPTYVHTLCLDSRGALWRTRFLTNQRATVSIIIIMLTFVRLSRWHTKVLTFLLDQHFYQHCSKRVFIQSFLAWTK